MRCVFGGCVFRVGGGEMGVGRWGWGDGGGEMGGGGGRGGIGQSFVVDISAFLRLVHGWRRRKNLHFNLSRNIRKTYFDTLVK